MFHKSGTVRSKYFLNLDAVVMLASVVGDPITKKYPIFANEVNVKQTKQFINSLVLYQPKKIIFVSTCSNYGVIKKSQPVKENYKLNPKSIYAKNKVNIEKYLYSIRRKFKSEILKKLPLWTAFAPKRVPKICLFSNQSSQN